MAFERPMKLSRNELQRLTEVAKDLPKDVVSINLTQECPSTLGITTYVSYDPDHKIDLTQSDALE